MPSIFISFSTDDGEDIAQHVYRLYKKNGHNVFYSPKEIAYGSTWREEIKKRIEGCDIFLVVATYGAIESEEVTKEIDEAKRLGKRIIPCRPSDVEWSDLEKLGIDLTQGPEFDSKEELVRKLESQLRREFASKSVPAESVKETPTPTKKVLVPRSTWTSARRLEQKIEDLESIIKASLRTVNNRQIDAFFMNLNMFKRETVNLYQVGEVTVSLIDEIEKSLTNLHKLQNDFNTIKEVTGIKPELNTHINNAFEDVEIYLKQGVSYLRRGS